MRKIFAAACLALFTLTFDCRADGLDTLIEVARSQGAIAQEYAEETKAFDRVKKAIDCGDIKKGQTEKDLREDYGEPVVVLPEDRYEKREIWIYKPASSSFFKGVRATLFFTADGLLDEARLEER